MQAIRAAAVAALAAAGPAAGNDSVAALAVGGLELLRSDAIEMRSEELFIRPDGVQVRYVFRNREAAPVDTLVAFPLPAVGYPFEFDWVPIPVEDDANYVGFSTRIDGKPAVLGVESRALLLGLDRTARLAELGVPLAPFLAGIEARLAALPQAVRAALAEELLLDGEGRPLWQLATTFWRRQTFPPGRDVVVEHRYIPVRGGSAMSPAGNIDDPEAADDLTGDWIAQARAEFCIEPEVERALIARRLQGAAPGARHYSSSEVAYVLSTGANWRGPIGRFRLTVEAPHPMDAVFVCLEGARRTAPNRIEADLTEFWPAHDLRVLFVHLWGDDIARDD